MRKEIRDLLVIPFYMDRPGNDFVALRWGGGMAEVDPLTIRIELVW